jgi:hypothetical protein
MNVKAISPRRERAAIIHLDRKDCQEKDSTPDSPSEKSTRRVFDNKGRFHFLDWTRKIQRKIGQLLKECWAFAS